MSHPSANEQHQIRRSILDIDGTLVDSNYQHALAWFRAFREQQIVLPIWRIHHFMGMGGDQLVGALCGDDVEERIGDRVRAAEPRFYREMIGEVEPMEGARELIEAICARGGSVILASSAKPEEVERYVDLVGARELVEGWTSSGDVDATKPRPDLIEVALERGGGDARDAVLVGDSIWDCEAASRAGVTSVAVLTGGFSAADLTEHGASIVFESLGELLENLDQTPLVS